MSRKKKSKLEIGVRKFKPITDGKRRFVPYCDFGYHQGSPLYYEVCENRKCNHYQRLYLPFNKMKGGVKDGNKIKRR